MVLSFCCQVCLGFKDLGFSSSRSLGKPKCVRPGKNATNVPGVMVDSANMPSPIAMFDFFLNNCGMLLLLLLLDVERDVNNCKDC